MGLLLSAPAYAARTVSPAENQQRQVKKITGTVVSTKGEPIPGATVFIKGTRTGTTTDFEGNFSLNAAAGDILEVSVLGFEGTEIVKQLRE